jgi:IclR family transcriptional regulator, pca regulon regulatory protein
MGLRIEEARRSNQCCLDNLRDHRQYCAMNAQKEAKNNAIVNDIANAKTNAIAKADFIAGMAKGMAVLESFDTERQRLNATLAAQRAGITRAAARRHLLTLAHLGYLETDGSFYWLSSKVLRFSGSYLASAQFPRVLQPTLNRLAAQTGESFSAVVRDADEVVIVAKSSFVTSLQYKKHSALSSKYAGYTPYGLHLGARLPIHATSTGQVLLAQLPASDFDVWAQGRRLPRLTAHTCTDMQQFKALIQQIRAQDYAIASQMHELGVHALAVPIRDATGRTVAALNVVTQLAKLELDELQNGLLPLLQEAARELRALV